VGGSVRGKLHGGAWFMARLGGASHAPLKATPAPRSSLFIFMRTKGEKKIAKDRNFKSFI